MFTKIRYYARHGCYRIMGGFNGIQLRNDDKQNARQREQQ